MKERYTHTHTQHMCLVYVVSLHFCFRLWTFTCGSVKL